MAPGWGGGATTGYPVPGEGAFPGGGSGRRGNELGVTGTVNSATQNLILSLPVVRFPTRGDLEVDFTLYHNSHSSSNAGFGTGWTHSYSTHIVWTLTHAFVEMPDGLVVPYTKSGPNYIAPPGWYAKLEDTMTGRKLTMRDQTVYEYTTTGTIQELTAIRDRSGNQITIAWSSGKLQTVTAPDTRTLTFAYDGASLIDTITGPDSKGWDFTCVGKQLVSVQYPQPMGKNRLVTFTYDGDDNVTQELDPEGEFWTWTYSGDDVTGWQDPASTDPASATFTPITGGLEMQPGFGPALQHIYSAGLLWIDLDGDGFFTEYAAYDSAINKPTDVYDKRGKHWEYAYNSVGQVTDKLTPLGKLWQFSYTAFNDIDVVTSPIAGGYVDYDYDGLGRLIEVTQSVDNAPTDREVVTLDYDGNGDILWTRDALKRQTDYVVNTYGDIEEVYPPDNADKFFAYDDYGRLTDSYDNAPNLTTYTYDETGWITQVDQPDSSTVSFAYDNRGSKTDFWDELNRHQTWEYDESIRMVKHTNARGDENEYQYNFQDLVYIHRNGNGTEWVYYYTGRGELYALVHPSFDYEVWIHDGNGNTSESFLNYGTNLDHVEYGYDDDNRLTDIDYPTDTDVTFDYDDANRRTEMVDGTGTTNWTYDLAGQVTELDSPQGDLTYTYNADGTRDTMTEVGLGATTYSWDALTGQLNSLTNRFSETTSYDYDPSLGHLTRKTLHDGQYEAYQYDSRYRATHIDVFNSGNSPLHETEYVVNVASEVESTIIDTVQTDYVYDDASQLEEESRPGYTCSYTYDDNGNRLNKVIAGGIAETYNYDPEERLTSVTWNGGSNYKNFTYDDGGRITAINNTGSTRNFTYDEESRLVAISGAYSATYEYNGLRTRIEKTEGAVTQTFMRDGAGVTAPVLNDGAAAYTPGTSERRSGVTTYMHSGIKNADLQTNTSELQTAERVYDAFGNLTASSGSFVGPFGYGGQFGYQEDGSGLKLLGHRYYDPSIGRFLTRDPIKDGTNWYAYCENNPVSAYDATGLKAGQPYNTANEAAMAALAEAMALGLATGLEWGGVVYEKDGKYYYTPPHSGTKNSVNNDIGDIPAGTTAVGGYHCHPADDDFLSERDRQWAEDFGIIWVASVNSGKVSCYDPKTDEYTGLGRIPIVIVYVPGGHLVPGGYLVPYYIPDPRPWIPNTYGPQKERLPF